MAKTKIVITADEMNKLIGDFHMPVLNDNINDAIRVLNSVKNSQDFYAVAKKIIDECEDVVGAAKRMSIMSANTKVSMAADTDYMIIMHLIGAACKRSKFTARKFVLNGILILVQNEQTKLFEIVLDLPETSNDSELTCIQSHLISELKFNDKVRKKNA